MATQVNIVPHTHWDREWYKPFPLFRMQLVELLDQLLDALDDDPAFTHFQLDGQMAVVDDYLAIRPERGEQLLRLTRSGRISVGPWYTLPDEFLVSGETHVRNLALGMSRAEVFGGPMRIGYLPDMFGHIAQMPQLLTGFGFTDAVVWRGVPEAVRTPAFRWEAPDGSSVRAEYLPEGYGNGSRLPTDGDDFVARVDAFERNRRPHVGDPVLWMNGTDHQVPDASLPGLVEAANRVEGGPTFTITSLAHHLAAGARDGLPTWRGEMRSGARSNLLMGTASARIDVKQAAALAERLLERVTEPLAALHLAADRYPHAFLDHAWLDVIRNAAHDSICGCSADEVNDAVLHRYAESTRVAEALRDRATARVIIDSGQGAIVLNPTARPRATTATLTIDGETPPPHTQQIALHPQRTRVISVPRESARDVVARAILEDLFVTRYEVGAVEDGELVFLLHLDRTERVVDENELRGVLDEIAVDGSIDVVHVDHRHPSVTQDVLLRSATVPGFGWRGLAPDDLGDHAVRADGAGLTNGLLTIEPDPSDGTFSLDGVPGHGRLVDGGDAGDTYNWSPPARDGIVDRPDDVEVHVVEAGPVRGVIEITRTYRIPERVEDGHRAGEVDLTVLTRLELHAGEDRVRVRMDLDNRAEDHRLRVHLPLPEPADTSTAECAFTAVTRGLDAEGGPTEEPLPTFPSRRFVRAGGLTVLHDGLCEYELVDIRDEDDGRRAHELALTILRSVGTISRGPMIMRALPAGPPTLTSGAQMPGRHRVAFDLHVGDRDPWALADEALTPMPVEQQPGLGFGDPDVDSTRLRVDGAEVSALRRRADGRLELRVFETTGSPSTLTVTDGDGTPVTGRPTDLAGRELEGTFDGRVELPADGIATFALDEPAQAPT